MRGRVSSRSKTVAEVVAVEEEEAAGPLLALLAAFMAGRREGRGGRGGYG
jgi:hypothetical protein